MQNLNPQQLQALLGQGGGFGRAVATVEFKAGRMNYDGRMVTPDRRKGCIKIIKDPMGCYKFQWCDESDNPIDDMLCFPGDCKFEKVKQSDDRVYLLEIGGTNRFFYWMQESDKEGDAERCKKVHDTLNGIDSSAQDASQPASSAPAQMSAMSSSSAAAAAAPSNNMQAQQHQMLQNFMADMQMHAQQSQSPSIGAIIKPDDLHKLLESMSEEDKNAMLEHLPDGQKTADALRDNVLSPQLRQAMQSFTEALRFSPENVEMMMMMADLENGADDKDGIDSIIKAFIRKYEKKD